MLENRAGMKKAWILAAFLLAAAVGAYHYWFSSDAYVKAGYELYSKGEWEASRDAFGKAVERDPGNADAYLGRARTQFSEKIIEDYDKVLELSPNNALAYLERAEAYRFWRGDLAKAIEDCDRAIEIGDFALVSYCVRAHAHLHLGDYASALADCARALELDPQSARAYAERARIHEAQEQYEDATADYGKALECAESKPYQERLFPAEYASACACFGKTEYIGFVKERLEDSLRIARGRSYIAAGKREDAAAVLAEAGDRASVLLCEMGDAFYGDEKYSDAIFFYTKAIEREPENALHYEKRGRAYRMLGDAAQAEEDFVRARVLEMNKNQRRNGK